MKAIRTVILELDEAPERLRWGMADFVGIELDEWRAPRVSGWYGLPGSAQHLKQLGGVHRYPLVIVPNCTKHCQESTQT